MIILNYRPSDDQFWIGCTFEEAESKIISLMNRNDILKYLDLKKGEYCKLSKEYVQGIRECYGINEIPEAYFNISRDLKVCYPEFPLFPFAGQWNAYCPFVDCDHVEIKDLSELKQIEVTFDGKPISNQ